ncbi:hypothetical protein JTE90_010970 [Oedothorax gibbosus]|uniref:Uncharacterized protein n=1 Tax=Oedothorax gibbosus TaxID=931172 RepID=A0AAV6TNF8_9ARAC|nr:hypothetical protein JTE90_010970 [Oedothorax gibbosus]
MGPLCPLNVVPSVNFGLRGKRGLVRATYPFPSVPYQLPRWVMRQTMVVTGEGEIGVFKFRRGSLRNGYHIQGRQQARKLPTPGTGR